MQSPSNNQLIFWLQQKQKGVESEVARNQARIRVANSMLQIVQLSQIHLPAELRALRHSIHGLNNLKLTASQKLIHLIELRVKEISACATLEAARLARGKFMRECEVLRGYFPLEYQKGESASRQALYRLEKNLRPAVDEPPPSS